MDSEEDIFEAAAALPAEERPAYLDVACAGQPEMRARLEALLRSHDASGFMEDRTAISPGGMSAESARGPLEQPGQMIGRYKLPEQIGEGGFGVVWMAEQLEPVRRRVAVKVIKPGMDTKEVIARFESERQALAMMDDPNIARVFDAGATDSGRPYFVMELVKGIPITRFCDEQQFTTRQRLELFADVCSAINHAHQKGVIHRDIKPSNVMVTLNGERPVVKVIDFGIAKATQGRLTDKTLFTHFAQFVGTPAYMSPEQAAISELDIDTRSDIYSLGVLLYELLTGNPPFDPTTLLSSGYEEMRRIIREVDPPKPSSRMRTVGGDERASLARARNMKSNEVRRMVDRDLDWVVMKAIDKDRRRRYATANGLAVDIERFLTNQPVSARSPSTGYRLRKFAGRNKEALAIFVPYALFLIALFVSADLPGTVRRWDWKCIDRITSRFGSKPNSELSLIGIDDASLNVLDILGEEKVAASPELDLMRHGYPYPRSVYASLIRKLLGSGARLIVFDMLFLQPSDDPVADAELKSTLEEFRDRVVIGSGYVNGAAAGQDRMNVPDLAVIDWKGSGDPRVGFVNFFPDEDGVVRRAVAARRASNVDSPVYHSLALAAMKQLGHEHSWTDPEVPRFFRYPRYTPRRGERDFELPYPPIPIYTIFLEEAWEKNFGSGAAFKDKIVFVGGTSDAQFHDVFNAPHGTMLGAQLQMSVLSSALNGEFQISQYLQTSLSRFSYHSLMALMAVLGFVITTFIGWKWRMLVALVVAIGYLCIVGLLYARYFLIVPPVTPLVTLFTVQFLWEFIRLTFTVGRYHRGAGRAAAFGRP